MAAPWRSPYDLVCTALAFALGLCIGWLDLHATEVTVTIVALLAAGLLLGLLEPRAAWRWAALLAIGLPVMAVIGRLTGMQTPEPIKLDPLVTLVALGFALVGSYAGVVVRRGLEAFAGGGARSS